MPSNDPRPEICMFRGNAWGGAKTVRRILSYFGVDAEDFSAILSTADYEKTYENVTVTTAIDECEKTEIRIRIDKTI